MKRTSNFSLSVAVVVLAIIYIYLSTVFVFIDRWLGLWTSPGLMNAVVFTSVAIMCVFCYYLAIFMDPGRVPSTYIPDIEDSDTPIHEIKRKQLKVTVPLMSYVNSVHRDFVWLSKEMEVIDSHFHVVGDIMRTVYDFTLGGDLRYCQKCSHFKPPRAHHCRVCKRCVLRMDHHCIWISNCVGHANYKVFFVFVVHAVIACSYSLVLLVGSLTVDPLNNDLQNVDSFRSIYVISGLLLVPLCIALGVLLGWHIYLILQNKTTIEYHEGVRAMWLTEKGGNVYRHPYDVGAYENLTTVLGPSIFCWVCPSSRHIGSGIRFRTAYDNATTESI